MLTAQEIVDYVGYEWVAEAIYEAEGGYDRRDPDTGDWIEAGTCTYARVAEIMEGLA